MSLLQIHKLTDRLKAITPRTRDLAAAEIGDLLEADAIPEREYKWLLPLLIERAVGEADPVVKESLFNALSSAPVEKLSIDLDLQPIAVAMSDLDVDCLEHALHVLGFSGNESFRKRIKQFVTHADENIRRTATEALEVLEAMKKKRLKNAVKHAGPATPKRRAL